MKKIFITIFIIILILIIFMFYLEKQAQKPKLINKTKEQINNHLLICSFVI